LLLVVVLAFCCRKHSTFSIEIPCSCCSL
jgi:hypothetical protein